MQAPPAVPPVAPAVPPPPTPVCASCGKLDNNVSPQTRVKRCGRCMGALYCNEACQREDWPEHKKTCRTRIDPLLMSRRLHAFRVATMRDIEFLLMMIHIPGLFEGTCIPTFHLSFRYDPRQQDIRQQLQFTASVLTEKDAHLEHMRTLGLEGTQQSDTWDASQQEVQHMKASIELESPTTAASLASHSALFKCIFSVVGRDSTSQFVESTGSNGHIRHFTESALDPRNIDLDWEGALRLYFSDARQDDHLSKTPSQLCAMAVKYFSRADEAWRARGEAWVSLRIPRGFQRLLSESPAVLYSMAGESDPVVETGLRRFAYAFPHEIDPSPENDII